MASVIQKACLREALLDLGGSGGADLTIRLFRNDFTPTGDDLFSDFDEAAFTGYSAVTGGWSAPAATGSDAQSIQSAVVVWTRGSGGSGDTIYGWMITKETVSGTTVLLARRYAVPRPMDVAGLTLPLSVSLLSRRVG